MDLTQMIPFLFGALILLWAAASGARAFSGGQSSGLHDLAPARAAPSPQAQRATAQRRARRSHAIARAANYLLALAVLAALVLMLYGTLVA
ncbi:MAG: hypothetical protein EXR65_04355 [Dehalococcoidia bacterium]|nr:hypothetical protein [Dehalococcoidia bacterium]